MKKTKSLTFSAVSSAIIVALLYLASIVKTGTLSFQYVCGLIIMLTSSRCGIASGMGVFGVSSLLLFFLLPDKTAAISFTLFFGIFPIVKYFAEKCRRTFEWILKVVCFNAAVLIIYFVFAKAFGVSFEDFGPLGKYGAIITLAVGNAVFVVYDIAVARMAMFYTYVIRPKIKGLLK